MNLAHPLFIKCLNEGSSPMKNTDPCEPQGHDMLAKSRSRCRTKRIKMKHATPAVTLHTYNVQFRLNLPTPMMKQNSCQQGCVAALRAKHSAGLLLLLLPPLKTTNHLKGLLREFHGHTVFQAEGARQIELSKIFAEHRNQPQRLDRMKIEKNVFSSAWFGKFMPSAIPIFNANGWRLWG